MSYHPSSEEEPESPSQVSRIIQQMHDERPSVEKSREVVIDKDGNKKIRVVKKRRVSASVQRKESGNRRWTSLLLILALLAIVGGGVFFTARFTSMSGESYRNAQQQALAQAWGAESVTISLPSTESFQLEIGSITARFPADNLIERVEITGISGTIALKSYITGIMSGDLMEISRVRIYLRDTVHRLETPRFKGDRLWNFDRYRCADFQILFADADRAPFRLKTSAYLYAPNERAGSHSLALQGGTLELRSWPVINLEQGNILTTYKGLEEINFTGTVDLTASGRATTESVTINLRGSILENSSLRAELDMVSANVPLALLTRNKLERIVTAVTRHADKREQKKAEHKNLTMLLPAFGETSGPEFNGRAPLGNVQFSIRNLPAIGYLLRHVESRKREKYAPPTIREGAMTLRQKGDYIHIDMMGDDLSDPYVITIQGGVSVDENDRVSGQIAYGLPVMLTQAEYPDAKSDPLFTEDQRLAWLHTRLSGTAQNPSDNADELELKAAPQRQLRPKPNSLITPALSPDAFPPAVPGSAAPATPARPDSEAPAANPDQEDLFLRTLQPGS